MDKEPKASTFDSLKLDGLSFEQKTLLRDYMSPHEGVRYYAQRAQLMIDFLRNPDSFKPSDQANCSSYCDFVLRHFDGKMIWPIQVKPSDIDWERLQNVSVHVVFEYSSTADRRCPVVVNEADARKDSTSPWEHFSSGGIAFSLDDWVQKK